MDTTHADIPKGQRHDLTVESATLRSLDFEATHVHPLSVKYDAGTQFDLLTTPQVNAILPLKTGATYRVRFILRCDPVEKSAARDGFNEENQIEVKSI